MKEDASDQIKTYSSSALAFGGDSKTVKKHLGPLQKILEMEVGGNDQDRKSSDATKARLELGGGF